jgi:spermidine/putrescine transport system permease protein
MKERSFSSRLSAQFAFSMGAPALIWQVLFFYIPLFLILVSSVIRFAEDGSVSALTLDKWLFFMQPLYLSIIGSSFLLALGNATLCLLIGYPLAYFIAFKGSRLKNILLFLLIVPFWTNFLLHVYAWFFVLEREGFINLLLQSLKIVHQPVSFLNSLFSVMIMMVYYYLPFMVLPLYASLEKLNPKLLEASADLGASFLQTIRRVVLPLTTRGILAGFFLVYIPSFGEFAIPELMGGDKKMFVGSVVSHYILGEETGDLGAAFTAVSTLFLLSSAVILYFGLRFFLKKRLRS